MNTDIHNFEGKLKKVLKDIKESTKIPECNRKTLMEYYLIKKNNNREKSTINRDLRVLKRFSEIITKPFDKITRNDIIGYFGNFKVKKKGEWKDPETNTLIGHQRVLKTFYKTTLGK